MVSLRGHWCNGLRHRAPRSTSPNPARSPRSLRSVKLGASAKLQLSYHFRPAKSALPEMADLENGARRPKEDPKEDEFDEEPDYQPVDYKKLLFSWKYLRMAVPNSVGCRLANSRARYSNMARLHRHHRPRHPHLRRQEPDRRGMSALLGDAFTRPRLTRTSRNSLRSLRRSGTSRPAGSSPSPCSSCCPSRRCSAMRSSRCCAASSTASGSVLGLCPRERS